MIELTMKCAHCGAISKWRSDFGWECAACFCDEVELPLVVDTKVLNEDGGSGATQGAIPILPPN